MGVFEESLELSQLLLERQPLDLPEPLLLAEPRERAPYLHQRIRACLAQLPLLLACFGAPGLRYALVLVVLATQARSEPRDLLVAT